MRFTRVYLKNFGVYNEADLLLQNQGVRAIVAEREDSGAFDSNGAGKSTLFNALYWALFGELPQKVPAHEVVRRGSKGGCSVLLEAVTDDGQDLMIERAKGGGSRGSNKISISLGGNDVTPKGRGEPEKLIEKLLGTSRSAFGYAAFFGSSEVFRFSAATDAARKTILAQMLQFDLWEDALEAAKAEAKVLDTEVTQADSQLTAYTDQRTDIDGRIAQEQARIAQEGQEIDGRLRDTEQRLGAARGALTATDELLRKRGLAEKMISDQDTILEENHSRFFAAQQDVAVRKATATAAIRAAQAAINGLNQDTCPTCGGPLTFDGRDEHIAANTEVIRQSELTITEADDDLVVVDVESTRVRDEANAEKAKINKMLAMINAELAKAESAQASVRNLEEQLNSLQRAKDSLRAGLDQLEQQRTRATSEIERLTVEVEEKTDAFNLAKFWVEGFGKKGIQAWLLDEVIPFLEERTNTYLTTLSDGALIADFGTQVEGSKKTLEKLDISVLKDGLKAHVGTLSGGERRRFDLAVSFALHDLLTQRGVRSSCLFLDEVFDTLDETGSDRVVDVIQQKQNFSGVESVFVISHSQRVVQAFPNRITVKHKNGESWLEEN